MEAGKLLQNLTSSVTGNNVKAVLCIRKVSQQIDQENNNAIDAIVAEPDKAKDDYDSLNQQLYKKAQASLNGKAVATYDTIREMADSHNYIAIEVQYNPSSLRLETIAGLQRDFGGNAAQPQMSQYKGTGETTLSLELLFDDTNNMDAFMLGDNPLLGATASNLTNTVTSGIRNAKGGYSVQRQMEGFMSLLTIETAQNVIFFWGDMSFHGKVTDVDMVYTMFNKKGHPIRGTVNLTIRQSDEEEQNQAEDKQYRYDVDYWNKAFESTFTEAGSGGLLDTVNKATNNSLLNLKL
jgi:hypothetical protein